MASAAAGGASGLAERLADRGGGLSVGRIVEDPLDRLAQLVRADATEPDPHPGPGAHHLVGHDRLVVADRGQHQRQTVGQALAHGVVPAVADHRVEVPEQRHLGHPGADQHVGDAGGDRHQVGRRHQHGLQVGGGQRLDGRGHEPGSRLGVDRPQRDQHVAPVRIQPLPRERGRVGAVGEAGSHELDGGGRRRQRPDQRGRGEGDDQLVGEAQIADGGHRRVDPEADLEIDQLGAHPGVDLGQVGQRIGELGRGGGRGDPGDAPKAGDHRAGHGLLVDHHQVGLEVGHQVGQLGGGGRGVGDDEVLPQELQRGRAPEAGRALAQIVEGLLVEGAHQGREGGAGGQQDVDHAGQARPDHVMALRRQLPRPDPPSG